MNHRFVLGLFTSPGYRSLASNLKAIQGPDGWSAPIQKYQQPYLVSIGSRTPQ